MCKLKMQPGTLTFCQNLFTVLSGRQRGITLHFNGYKHNKILKYPENCIISSDYQFYVKS